MRPKMAQRLELLFSSTVSDLLSTPGLVHLAHPVLPLPIEAQHLDLGIVSLSAESAASAGYIGPALAANSTGRYIRLRTISANSTNQGASNPLSHPNILALPKLDASTPIQLQVEAVNHTTYEFRYSLGLDKWTPVGWGNSSQVSGGYMGTILGVFATGNGANVATPAYIWDWSYEGNPRVI